ncbi:MAG: ornithine carbamoyltransferase [Acidobacteriaceae bacterium]
MASRTLELDQSAPTPARHYHREHRDLLSISDCEPSELESLLDLAGVMKAKPNDFRGALDGKMVVLFFEKPSLRTRLTFEAGVNSLGGKTFFVDQTTARLGDREPIHDVAKNLERWVDGVVLRTFSHATVETFAECAHIPVVNGLSDVEHPCQALADYLTLRERFGDLRHVNLTYVGDGNNVAHSLLLAAAGLGSSITIATPRGYEPDRSIVSRAQAVAHNTGGKVQVTTDPARALKHADAVYTDVWASMGQEDEAAKREQIFGPFQVNAALMAHAPRHAVFMHCLPAHRGSEVTAEVIDSNKSVVFDQAENRLHIQKAILLQLLGNGLRRFGPRPA